MNKSLIILILLLMVIFPLLSGCNRPATNVSDSTATPGQISDTSQKTPVTEENAVQEETPASRTPLPTKTPTRKPIKVLGNGNITHPLVINANTYSSSAKQKVEAAGGVIEVGDAAKTA